MKGGVEVIEAVLLVLILLYAWWTEAERYLLYDNACIEEGM
jgi:hypothetical protein